MSAEDFSKVDVSSCGYPGIGIVKTPFCYTKIETSFVGSCVPDGALKELFDNELQKINKAIKSEWNKKDKRRNLKPAWSILTHRCNCPKSKNDPICLDTDCRRWLRNVECPNDCSKNCRNSMFDGKQMVNPKVFLKYIPVKEWCLFADQDIPPNSAIFEFRGEIITEEELLKDPISVRYAMRLFNSNFYVDPSKHGNVERFCANSCAPNSTSFSYLCQNGEVKNILYTEEGIKRGQEITFNYNTGKYKDMTCFCGSPKCKDIGEFLIHWNKLALRGSEYSTVSFEELTNMKLNPDSKLAIKEVEDNDSTTAASNGSDEIDSDADTEIAYEVQFEYNQISDLGAHNSPGPTIKRKAGKRTQILEYLEMTRNFACCECGTRFAEKRLLSYHIKRHNKGQIQCSFPNCSKTVTAAAYSRHLKSHTNQKTHPCGHANCTKLFARAEHARSHMRICKKT